MERSYSKKTIRRNSGFTLIELSIVMVIIGLIIGGILTGQELIHGAGVRATISQVIKYNSAVNTFTMKYNAIPGDFSSAATYIVGAQSGNGDGLIGAVAGPSTPSGESTTAVAPTAASIEFGNFWSHLSAIGLVEGSYTAVSTAASALALITNFPATKVSAGGGLFVYGNSGDYNNYYHLGVSGVSATGLVVSSANLFSAEDARNIDTKMDDGNPNTGIVSARGGTGLEIQPSVSGAASLSASNTTGCIIGAAFATTLSSYNTAGSTASAVCQLRIRVN